MDARTPPEEIAAGEPQPFLRLPWPVTVLAALMLGINGVISLLPAARADQIIFTYGFIPARYSAAFLAAHQVSLLERVLPFFTYMFLHGGWMHVGVNTIWLLAFAPVAVRRFGALRFFGFFILCGLAGCARLSGAQLGIAREPAIGASGAISGLMAAGFRLIGREGDAFRPPSPAAPLLSRQILIWSLVWIGTSISSRGMTGLGTGGAVQPIAWQAHLGGYIAGLLLTGPFDHWGRLKRRFG